MSDQLTALVQSTSADLLAYLRRRVSEPEDAADLLGDTFAALAAAPERIPESEQQARMWAFGVARRTLLAFRRRRGERDERTRQLRAMICEDLAHPGDDDAVIHHTVRAQVARLPTRQRELVMLVYWDGFSIEDAATHLGMRAPTARTHLHRARTTLRRQWELEQLAEATESGGPAPHEIDVSGF